MIIMGLQSDKNTHHQQKMKGNLPAQSLSGSLADAIGYCAGNLRWMHFLIAIQ